MENHSSTDALFDSELCPSNSNTVAGLLSLQVAGWLFLGVAGTPFSLSHRHFRPRETGGKGKKPWRKAITLQL